MIKGLLKLVSIKTQKLSRIDDIDVNQTPVSKKGSYGKKRSFKQFIGYNDNENIKLLCKKFPQMIGYVKYFKSNNKAMFFKVIDKKLFKKYMRKMGKKQQFNKYVICQ